MTDMQLFYAPPSPYARKVRVVAHELDVPLDLILTNAMAMEGDFGTVNPVNRIPALRLDDGEVLFDSPVICEYLNEIAQGDLLPRCGADRYRGLKLQALGDGIMDAAVPWRYELARLEIQRSTDRIALYRRSVNQILDYLEKDCSALETINFGSIAIACALGYLDFRFADEGWSNARPRLRDWAEAFSQRPSMLATPMN